MIFRLFRESGLPLILEEEEVHTIKTLEAQGRWTELDDLYHDLRKSDDLKEMRVEANSLGELRFCLEAIDDEHDFIIDFKRMLIIIQDQGRDH